MLSHFILHDFASMLFTTAKCHNQLYKVSNLGCLGFEDVWNCVPHQGHSKWMVLSWYEDMRISPYQPVYRELGLILIALIFVSVFCLCLWCLFFSFEHGPSQSNPRFHPDPAHMLGSENKKILFGNRFHCSCSLSTGEFFWILLCPGAHPMLRMRQ